MAWIRQPPYPWIFAKSNYQQPIIQPETVGLLYSFVIQFRFENLKLLLIMDLFFWYDHCSILKHKEMFTNSMWSTLNEY